MDSDELMLLGEIAKKNNHSPKRENLEAIELASIASTDSSEKYNDNNSRTPFLDSEEEGDCGTFDCMGKNDDFCCCVIL